MAFVGPSTEDASRLAALLSMLQSWDYVAESLTQHVVGERAGWIAVTLLEAWKATCRLRLLSHVKRGRLMSSFAPNEPHEAWSAVVHRLGAVTDELRCDRQTNAVLMRTQTLEAKARKLAAHKEDFLKQVARWRRSSRSSLTMTSFLMMTSAHGKLFNEVDLKVWWHDLGVVKTLPTGFIIFLPIN